MNGWEIALLCFEWQRRWRLESRQRACSPSLPADAPVRIRGERRDVVRDTSGRQNIGNESCYVQSQGETEHWVSRLEGEKESLSVEKYLLAKELEVHLHSRDFFIGTNECSSMLPGWTKRLMLDDTMLHPVQPHRLLDRLPLTQAENSLVRKDMNRLNNSNAKSRLRACHTGIMLGIVEYDAS
jgi:hypothetical protein